MRRSIYALALGFTVSQAAAQDVSRLSDAELERQYQALLKERQKRNVKAEPSRAASSARAGFGYNGDQYGNPHVTLEDLRKANYSKMQNLYIRSDPLDAFAYPFPLAKLDGKGASLSYTANEIAKTQTFTTSAFLSYVLMRTDLAPDTSFAIAPFLHANGNAANPQNPRTERNAIQFGIDSQLKLPGAGLFDFQLLGLRPYYQTDFRGDGRIYGVSALYEPYNVNEKFNLGGRIQNNKPALLAWYWRLMPEFNAIYVEEAGRTNFATDKTYAFAGGTVQFRSVFLENMESVPPLIRDRFYFNASYSQFWNVADNGRPIHDAQLEVGYVLGKVANAPPGASLITSLSLVYNNGINRLTYDKREQYKVQLNVQY